MYTLIAFDQEETYCNDFIALPKKLYSSREIVQNEKEERELLLGNHVLSKYFKLYKFLVYHDNKVVARCIITIYPNDDCAYLGFFESIEDTKCSSLLFQKAKDIARMNHCVKIMGPMDASFWIRYRLKTNHFNRKPYVSEPYNKSYYLDLFLAGGYQVAETYVSNYYKRPPLFRSFDRKSKARYEEFMQKGYTLVSPSVKEYDSAIRSIYQMIMELYQDFPLFKSIREEDFVKLFNSYQYILDFSFVKIAYDQGKAVGFVIAMPDYHNLLYGKIDILTYGKVFLKKIRSSNYVILYLGVKPEHRGLGNAIGKTIIDQLKLKRATSIGSLIKEGKVTKGYGFNIITSRNTYALLECKLDEE